MVKHEKPTTNTRKKTKTKTKQKQKQKYLFKDSFSFLGISNTYSWKVSCISLSWCLKKLSIELTKVHYFIHNSECAKFRRSGAIMGFVGLVPSRHCAFVGISWVQNIFSSVFRGSKIFSCGYFVSPKLFLWLFCGFKTFLVGILWVQNVFLYPKFFLVCSTFSPLGSFVIVTHKRIWNCVFYSKSISRIVNSVYIKKVFHLLIYLCYYAALVCTNCILAIFFLGNRVTSLITEIYSYCLLRKVCNRLKLNLCGARTFNMDETENVVLRRSILLFTLPTNTINKITTMYYWITTYQIR